MDISFPDNTTEIIDAIRGAIGRPIVIQVVASSIVCPTCGFNPVTEDALDPFCPTCSGDGLIFTYDYITVSGHVTWGWRDLPNWVTGGQYFTGDCVVQIKFTDEILDAVKRAKYFYVDGTKMVFQKYVFRGVPEVNRIIIDLRQEE
jgi:hypothetical protein